ncbi:MAG: ribonuclease HII [Actinomycetota bacterium]
MEPDGSLERALADAGFNLVAGVDEVGRGALAGPLYACAVILPHRCRIEGLNDSKLLTRLQRERLAQEVRKLALAISVVRIQPQSIDKRGLQRANLAALRRALVGLCPTPEYVLSDGFRPRRLPFPALAIKKGDRVSTSVAAASIIAKVARDSAMRRMARRFPGYGFETNVGYGTDEHWNALRKLGPCEIHRLSFAGVGGLGASSIGPQLEGRASS